MNERDAAEYDEASYTPDMAESDDPKDIIRDAVESVWSGRLPCSRNEFREQCTAAAIAILRALKESGKLDALMPGTKRPEASLLLAGVLGEIIESNNPALTARCAAIALDLGIVSESQTELAKRFGVTKGTPSHICRNIVETYLEGKPSHAMKSPEAVKKYSRLRKGKCAKQPAAPWEFAGTFAAAYARNGNQPNDQIQP